MRPHGLRRTRRRPLIAVVAPEPAAWVDQVAESGDVHVLRLPRSVRRAGTLWARGRADRRIEARLALRELLDRVAARWLPAGIELVYAPSLGSRRTFAAAARRDPPVECHLVEDLPDLRQLHADLDAALAAHPDAAFLDRHRATAQQLATQQAERVLADVVHVRSHFAQDLRRAEGWPGESVHLLDQPIAPRRSSTMTPTEPTLLLAGVAAARAGSYEALEALDELAAATLLVQAGEGLEPRALLDHPRVRAVPRNPHRLPASVGVVVAPSWCEADVPELRLAVEQGIPVIATRRAAGTLDADPLVSIIEPGDAVRLAETARAVLGKTAGMALPDLVPLEILFGNPDRAGAQLSPDGTQLAYLAPQDGVLNLWVGDVDGDTFEAVTADTVRGVRTYQWAHDGRHLLYLQDTAGDENWRVHTVDLTSSEVTDRTPFAGVQAQIIGSSARRPDEVLVGLNRDDARYHDVYRLHLPTGELTKEVANTGFMQWLIDHDLQVRGAVAPRSDGGLDYHVREGDGFRTSFTIAADDVVLNGDGPIAFTGDGSRVWFSTAVGSDTTRLVLKDLDTGDESIVAEHAERDLLPGQCRFHPDTHELQLLAWATDRFAYEIVDESLRPDLDALRAELDGDIHVSSRDHADARWIVAEVRDDGPVRYHLWDRATKTRRFLFDSHAALAPYTLATVEPFSFDARDGLRVHGVATFPPGVERRDLPTVLVVHGGPWGGRDQWGFVPECQWLANRGYLVLQVNYRGSGGYGKAFLRASAREWAGKMHDDLIDGIEHCIGLGWVVRERIGIYGGSYGGYAALVGATFTPDVFACAVDYVGPSNLVTLLKAVPPYWFGVVTQFHALLGHPDTDHDFLWSRSPLSRADDIRIPVFIAQGANDPRVPQAESEQIVEALVKAGVPHEYLLFEDEGHGFARPENRLTLYRRVEPFLAEHLGGRTSA